MTVVSLLAGHDLAAVELWCQLVQHAVFLYPMCVTADLIQDHYLSLAMSKKASGLWLPAHPPAQVRCFLLPVCVSEDIISIMTQFSGSADEFQVRVDPRPQQPSKPPEMFLVLG